MFLKIISIKIITKRKHDATKRKLLRNLDLKIIDSDLAFYLKAKSNWNKYQITNLNTYNSYLIIRSIKLFL